MKARHLAVLLILAAMSAASTAQLRGYGPYVGFDAGRAWASNSCDGLPAGFSCGSTATAFRGLVGWQFNPWWAAEFSYADFGDFNASGVYQGAPVNSTAHVSGFEIAAVGTLPMNPYFALTGRVGLASTDVSDSGFYSPSANTTTLALGAGLKLKVNRQVALHANYDYYGRVGNSATGTSDLGALTVGVTYAFW